MAVISATTERRHEGYFRREWRLAAERTLDIADDVMFLVPVVIDETRDSGARVPEKFTTVQWLRVPGGQPNPPLTALARRLVAAHTIGALRPSLCSPSTTTIPPLPSSSPPPPAFPS